MINSFFSVGGPPRIVNGIYDTLKEQGHECKIAAARAEMYKPEDSIMIGNKHTPYINALSCRFFDNDGFLSKSATKKLVNEIIEYDPDIIHLHNLHGYYINIEILFDYLKKSGKKIFWTLHDCWAFTGHCSYFSVVQCEQWKSKCLHCSQTKSYPSCNFKGRVKENFSRKKQAFADVPNMTIITPSQWLAKLARQSFLGQYPIEVVNNGVDLAKFSPSNSDFKKKNNIIEKKVVLGVAQVWDERKGLLDYFKLANTLSSEYQVVLVGLSKGQLKSLPKNVLGLSKTNSIEELVNIYSAADVFVNLTYEDNFPTVNIEALACGTPIITYNTGGSPEIADEENEIVCNQGDILQVKGAIESFTHGKKRYDVEKLTMNAKKYSRQIMTNKYLDIYGVSTKTRGNKDEQC